MKSTLITLLAVTALFTACKKNSDTPSRVSKLSAKINGVAFTADAVNVTVQSGYKMIKGTKSSGQSVTVFASDSTGVYSFGIYNANGTKPDSSQSFSVTSLSGNDSKSETGEFDFVTNDSVVITDGTYEAYW